MLKEFQLTYPVYQRNIACISSIVYLFIMSNAYLESSVLQNKVADIYIYIYTHIDDKFKKKTKITLIDYNNPDHFLNSFFLLRKKKITFLYTTCLDYANLIKKYTTRISLFLSLSLNSDYNFHHSFITVPFQASSSSSSSSSVRSFHPPTRFNISRTVVCQYNLPPRSQGQ